MALTFSTYKHLPKQKGGLRWRFVDVTFDDSYPTGGEAITIANVGLDTAIYDIQLPATLLGYTLEWDSTNSKIKVWMSDYNNAADGPFIELTNTSSALDGETIRCLVFGA